MNTRMQKDDVFEPPEESRCLVNSERDMQTEEESSRLLRSGLLVEGEASESESEELQVDKQHDTQLNIQEGYNPRQEDFSKEQKLYQKSRSSRQSLLENKLQEKNCQLIKQVERFTKGIFLSTAKDFQTLLLQMLKSKCTLQDASHSLRMVTNDLFHLEEKLDIVNACKILTDIKVPAV